MAADAGVQGVRVEVERRADGEHDGRGGVVGVDGCPAGEPVQRAEAAVAGGVDDHVAVLVDGGAVVYGDLHVRLPDGFCVAAERGG